MGVSPVFLGAMTSETPVLPTRVVPMQSPQRSVKADRTPEPTLVGVPDSDPQPASAPQADDLPSRQSLEAETVPEPKISESRRAPMFGLIASILVHAVLLILAAFILLNRPAGSGGAGDEVQLAIVTQTELTALQNKAIENSLPEVADASMSELLDPTLFDTPISASALDSSASDVSGMSGAGGSLGEGLDIGGAGGGSASFFGVEARGSRFAYIVDVSGSMAGPKIKTLRRELSGSLESLSEHAEFFVVFFSSDAKILGGRKKWTRALRRNKDYAQRDLSAVTTGGATNPLPAFEIAFNLRPHPDAIYFMTDGQFSELVVGEVARMNASWIEPIPIHTIAFVSREAESQLRRIADKSGGTYTYIPGPRQ